MNLSLGGYSSDTDSDGDGLNDGAEILASTNPLDSDSDDDGYADGTEIRAGSDPTDSNSTPDADLPILYYDFEGDSGSDVIDKGENGYNGFVARPDSTTLGDEGAPAGPSPATGASFSDGLIEVPDLDLSAIISSDGSYTLSLIHI